MILSTQLQFSQSVIGTEHDDDSSESTDGDEEEDQDEDMREEETNTNESKLIGNIESVEQTLREAKEHVRQYQLQRNCTKDYIKIAQLDVTNQVPPMDRELVLTMDMGQNIGLPNFSGNQPGDVYYFSPLRVYLFGVVDNATHDDISRINSYIWCEGDADRGGNNICSCLLKDFRSRGYFNQKQKGTLTIIADNCSGQNKNRHVIRFLMWMVEMEVFPKITLFFLIKGHTKNACDRMFNLLKMGYHCKDIFTVDQLLEILNENKFVKATRIDADEMKEFNK